ENLAKESTDIQKIVRRMNTLLLELQECLIGITLKEHNYQTSEETEAHRLKIVKGMTHRDLDIHAFQIWRMYDIVCCYLKELRLEVDKRARYGLMPVDGSDWEPADNGRPSIGPRIDMKEEDTGYA
ncbi:MAG: hypothetical protein ACRD8Z_18365, partial [Nitrososphaeraceae archaeon]